ncbi:hypothetical protein Nepgr_010857 [Nepenthes gracilis]|uniref:Uncharacterized protein n=1 Tax=Nepenthes gracilis TaxID=150966 RepID=A0AAD3SE78_NEPGR|nr:hypothetical protein Nepgr_010857 [Nepenthes gracilis]
MVDPWQWEVSLGHALLRVGEVHAHSPLPVALLYHDYIGQPVRASDFWMNPKRQSFLDTPRGWPPTSGRVVSPLRPDRLVPRIDASLWTMTSGEIRACHWGPCEHVRSFPVESRRVGPHRSESELPIWTHFSWSAGFNGTRTHVLPVTSPPDRVSETSPTPRGRELHLKMWDGGHALNATVQGRPSIRCAPRAVYDEESEDFRRRPRVGSCGYLQLDDTLDGHRLVIQPVEWPLRRFHLILLSPNLK